jgi:hypothetical protein
LRLLLSGFWVRRRVSTIIWRYRNRITGCRFRIIINGKCARIHAFHRFRSALCVFSADGSWLWSCYHHRIQLCYGRSAVDWTQVLSTFLWEQYIKSFWSAQRPDDQAHALISICLPCF